MRMSSQRGEPPPALRRLAVAGQDQDDPAHEAGSANDRPERHGMFLVPVDLDRAEPGHVLLGGVARVASVGERDNPDRDQNDPEDSSGLHRNGKPYGARRPETKLMIRMTTAMTR